MIGVAGGDEKTLSEATAMTVQISAESLSPLHHNQLPVITTELLASLYGTEVNGIQQNFKRNIARFVVGKHFFKLEGNELRDFKNRLTDSQSVAKHTRSSFSGQNAAQLAMPKCWKQNRLGSFRKAGRLLF